MYVEIFEEFFNNMAICLVFSFGVAWLAFPFFINKMKKIQGHGQPIREDGPKQHLETKKGTPTMGGLLIFGVTMLGCLIFADIGDPSLQSIILVSVVFAVLGFADDFLKITKNNTKGVSARLKMLVQLLTCLGATYLIQENLAADEKFMIYVPFMEDSFYLGAFYYVFAFFVIVGASNAVNLTDGLDGLAVSQIIIVAIALMILIFQQSFENSSEITIYLAALVGASMAFYWFNARPAKIFMGDVGSLQIGGALAVCAIATHCELFFALISLIFIIETISVMVQVSYFRLTKGKRIFRMTPIHHHFELSGWSEEQIVIRFSLVTILAAILALAIFL